MTKAEAQSLLSRVTQLEADNRLFRKQMKRLADFAEAATELLTEDEPPAEAAASVVSLADRRAL
jgi:hypothetical protein